MRKKVLFMILSAILCTQAIGQGVYKKIREFPVETYLPVIDSVRVDGIPYEPEYSGMMAEKIDNSGFTRKI